MYSEKKIVQTHIDILSEVDKLYLTFKTEELMSFKILKPMEVAF